MRLETGHRFRDYEIIDMIGSGGMGEVYLAKELLIERQVAIKRLNPILTQDDQFATRFRNEAQILAKLSHPNIVNIINFVREEGEYLMVLEYATGITLRDLIQRTGPIPESRSIRIFDQVASALAYAHSRGIIHRDVKPGNIMVDVQEGDRVKVMDFGIARFASDSHLTKTGSTLGTVRYMSPEQILSPRDMDLRSDIYSAGVVLYEMLSGRLPYEYNEHTDSEFLIQQLIVNQPIPDPRMVYGFISDATVAWLMAMTRKNRDERPETIPFLSQVPPTPAVYTPPVSPAPQPVIAEDRSSGEYFVPQPSRSKAWIGVLIFFLCLAAGLFYALSRTKRQDAIEPPMMEEVVAPAESLAPEPVILPVIEPQMTSIGGGYLYVFGMLMQLSDFRIGTYEVSRDEYNRCMKIPTSGNDELPVVSVSWMQAIEFCNRLSLAKGYNPCYAFSDCGTDPENWPASRFQPGSHRNLSCDWNADGYRLPTEMEWIYAANEAQEEIIYTYSGSNNLDRVAWYNQNTSSLQTRGLKTPNRLGLYDMSGNACEWVWDISGDIPEGDMLYNYRGADSGKLRIVKGGSVLDLPEWCDITKRGTYFPERGVNPALGFRWQGSRVAALN
jgi:serine/threonine protein kinase